MCTVTWLREGAHYSLLFNRDEKYTRAEAMAPREMQVRDTRVLLPFDPEGGGSWAASNEYGVTLCVLNANAQGRGQVSRGQVVVRLAGSRTALEAMRAAALLPLRRLAPFRVLALDRFAAWEARWIGDRLEVESTEAQMLTSSSYEPERVIAARTQQFDASPHATVEDLLRFHASHAGDGASSVCMHREDAATVSLLRVRVGASQSEVWYRPGSPCLGAPVTYRTLDLSEDCHVAAGALDAA